MTKRAPDWWLSAWDEYGESFDTGRIVQVTVGILEFGTVPAVAISVAGETPVVLAYDAVARLRESLGWAVAEHRMLLSRISVDGRAGDSDTAVLDRAQWQSVVAALQENQGSVSETLDVLMASAPPEWLDDTCDLEAEQAAPRRDVDRAQWVSVVAALQKSAIAHAEALDAVKASAPPAWVHDIEDGE